MKVLKFVLVIFYVFGLFTPACFCPSKGTDAQPAVGTLPVSRNPFGVMLPRQLVYSPQGMTVAKELGVTYFRPPQAIFINQWNGTCSACDAASAAGLRLVLTVSNIGGELQPSSPPADLPSYQKKIGEILDQYRPEVLVVENEENSAVFYTGTPQQYGAELTAACKVAHAKGIKCTNGGMVSTLVALLVWDHYTGDGDAVQARNFALKAFDPSRQRLLNSPGAKAQIEKGKMLFAAYKAAGIDYLNFHWYIANTTVLSEAVAYLQAQTGLPVITNEIGQFNEDPQQTTAVMQALVKLQIPVAIWFGLDGPKAKGLVTANGTLRSTGQAFKTFIINLSQSRKTNFELFLYKNHMPQ